MSEVAALKQDKAALVTQVDDLEAAAAAAGGGGDDNQPAVVKTALARNMLLPNGTFRGNIRITSDAELVVMLPLLEYITNIEGDLYIRYLSWLPSLDDVLAFLVRITGTLFIGGCRGLQSLANALPLLVEVGKTITLDDGNTKLETATLYTAFPLLETVDGKPLQTKANTPGMDDDGVYTGDLVVMAADFVTKRDMLKDLTKVTKVLNLNDLHLADLDNTFLTLEEVGTAFRIGSSTVQTMTGAFPFLVKVGTSFQIDSNTQLISVDGAFARLKVGTSFQMNSNSQLVSMDGSFLVLDSVTSFSMQGNNKLKSMNDGTFGKLTKTTTGSFNFVQSELESVDGLFPLLASVADNCEFNYHNQVQTMDGAFPVLSTVGSQLGIKNNDKLTTLGVDGGFKALTSIGSLLYFYGNGDNGAGSVDYNPGLVSFCASAKQKLCGLTSSYANAGWAYDSNSCCN